MPVKKRFREEPKLTECQAAVTSIDGKTLTLDETVFFAFAGGQASDRGSIGGIPVVEARAEGQEIFYTLEEEPSFGVGNTVKVEVDAGNREKIMRLHSAAHLVYLLFEETLGSTKLIGSNVTASKARLDYEYPESIKAKLPELEEKSNRFFSEDHGIVTVPDEEKPDRWLWQCQDWKIPCGGTHVASSKKIGPVRLKRRNIGGGKERIEITLA